jgi:hypothetical protein
MTAPVTPEAYQELIADLSHTERLQEMAKFWKIRNSAAWRSIDHADRDKILANVDTLQAAINAHPMAAVEPIIPTDTGHPS